MRSVNAAIFALFKALAFLLLLATAAGPAAAQSTPPWVEVAPSEALSVRVVVPPTTDCPTVSADGGAYAMLPRALPDAAFPVRVCEARVPESVARLSIGDVPLPALPATVNRIVVIGDTGCRLARYAVQDCDDPRAWPFAAIARAAAAKRPDLVIHVGDYYYRETACPTDRPGCAGSPFGDNWPAWRADFLDPAAPLLAVAPWVMVRGNHELCDRGGQGWFRLLDPYPGRADCVDSTPPYRLSVGGLNLLVFDSSDANDLLAPPATVALYAGQLAPLLAQAPAGSWLLLHHPVWALAPPGILGGFSTNQTMQAAIRGLIPPSLDVVLSGHVHDFIAYDFGPERPAQLIVGTGGDRLENRVQTEIAGAELDGITVRDGIAIERFGYMVLDRNPAGGWDGVLYAPDDTVLARCRIAGRSLGCR
ncbi:MAG: metallophosphoesterase [Alphaproteobacteria bacterium]